MQIQPPHAELTPSLRPSPESDGARIRRLEALMLTRLTKYRSRKSRRESAADMQRRMLYDVDAGSGDDIDDAIEAGIDDCGPKDYSDYGRCFARLGDPFSKVYTIVQHGLQVESRDTDDEGDNDTVIDKRLADDWKILCATIPGFRAEMVGLAEKRGLRRNVCLTINTGVDCARSDDTSGLKKEILTYLHLNVTVPLDPPIHPNNRRKSCRGWNHPVTACLMTPMELPANAMTYAEIKTGRRKVTAHQLPRFLYPEDHVYNEDDIECDLFRGHLMFRCAKHIFMGPSSALEVAGFKKGHAGIGKIIGLHKMTPRAVAYIAIQVRFAISDGPEWSVVDRHFNYETFFWNVVQLLEGEDGKEILAAYDTEVFGVVEDSAPEILDGASAESALNRIKEQRAAKRQRVE